MTEESISIDQKTDGGIAVKIEQYEAAAEAILFAMGDSVEAAKIASALNVSEREAHLIIKNLMDRYQKENCGLQIIELDHAYQMCTKPSMYDYLISIAKQPQRHALTDVMLETLSIVAYKQPVTRLEIEKIRGVSCQHAVNKLIEYNLIREVGRLNVPGKPILFGTTEEFLRCFGVQSVEELPSVSPDKIEEFKQEASEEAQLKLNL